MGEGTDDATAVLQPDATPVMDAAVRFCVFLLKSLTYGMPCIHPRCLLQLPHSYPPSNASCRPFACTVCAIGLAVPSFRLVAVLILRTIQKEPLTQLDFSAGGPVVTLSHCSLSSRSPSCRSEGLQAEPRCGLLFCPPDRTRQLTVHAKLGGYFQWCMGSYGITRRKRMEPVCSRLLGQLIRLCWVRVFLDGGCDPGCGTRAIRI